MKMIFSYHITIFLVIPLLFKGAVGYMHDSSGYSSGYGSGTHTGSDGSLHSGGYTSDSPYNHSGDQGVKTMVVAKEVNHENDGKIYTKDMSNDDLFGPENSVKSVDQKIHEMRALALKDKQDSLAAEEKKQELIAEKKRAEAQEKMEKAEMLQHQEEDIEKVLHSKKEELQKDIIPVVAVTPDSLGFQHHDELELMQLNDLRLASLQEAETQKENALLHENPTPKSPVEDLKSNPDVIKKFFQNAPVNKMSATVDPSKGKFSIMNPAQSKGYGYGKNYRRPVHGYGPLGGNTYSNRHSNGGGYSDGHTGYSFADTYL